MILICFSCVSPDSFDNVRTVWFPEVKKHVAKTPIVLCGLKTDLRTDNDTINKLKKEGQQPITKEEGEMLAKELKAAAYVECSAYTAENIQNVFQTAILVGLGEFKASHNSSGSGCLLA